MGKWENGSEPISYPEVEDCTGVGGAASWCYLFIHHTRVETVSKRLEGRYRVFIHKSIVYKRENWRIMKDERPTISGLVFIQGDGGEIQDFLTENFPGLHLVKDCAIKRIAVIPDRIMQPFIRVSEVTSTRIRVLPHSLDYYSVGNPLIRITSGILSGLEGYRIRISRDKCLVTTLGGITVAIGGIYKESFENLDEYVRQRREQLKKSESSFVTFTVLQAEIDKSFFTPRNQLDVIAISGSLTSWIMRVKSDMERKDFDEAVEIALFILEEVGHRFRTIYNIPHIGDVKKIMVICREIDEVLLSIIGSVDASTDLKEIVETGRESLVLRFPFLPIGL